MSKRPIPPFKEFAVGVATRAGNILARNFTDRQKRQGTRKNRYELVTASDKEVNHFVEFKIRQQFPEHNFLSEECEPIDRGSRYTWVLDPLDGTLNYTIANPFFTTTLALLEDNVPIIGVIYAPFTQEMFVAQRNGETRLNERSVHVSKQNHLADCVMSFSYFYRDKQSRRKSMRILERFEDTARGMRHLGSTTLELAYVACGRMDAVIITPPLRLWDIAAGMLMVEAAGGKVTDFAGQPHRSLKQGLVASNGLIHSAVLRKIRS